MNYLVETGHEIEENRFEVKIINNLKVGILIW